MVPATLAIVGGKSRHQQQTLTRAVALGYDVGMRAFQTVGMGQTILKDTHILESARSALRPPQAAQ